MLDWLGLDTPSAFDPKTITIDEIEQDLALAGASG